RQGEDNGNGLELGDHEKPGGIGGVHDVSHIDQTQSHAAADRGRNVSVNQLQFCIIDGGLVRLDRALKLADLCLLGIHLLLGDHSFVVEKLEALEVNLYVMKLSLVFG